MPNKIITAESIMQVDEKVNVTKKILGFLPYEYKDFNHSKI